MGWEQDDPDKPDKPFPPPEWVPGTRLLGSKEPSQKFKCGGWTGCDALHEFMDPGDVLVLNEAVELGEFRSHDHVWTQEKEDRAIKDRTLYIGRTVVIPTLLGMWLDDTAAN